MGDVYVYRYPLPVREVVRSNEDGTYTVLVNETLCYEQQMDAVNHALRHIASDDFSKTDVNTVEAQAHNAPLASDLPPISRFALSDEETPIFALKNA